jgi:hypothetical protein
MSTAAPPGTPATADLAGALRLCAGGPLPTIASSRPELVPRIAPGKPADALPDLLASLHSLCSQAHRLTARRAVAAARDRLDGLDRTAEAEALRLATARDQLLRLVHDWPRQLPGATPPGLSDSARDAAAALLLRSCPLWRSEWPAAERLAALPDWLAHHLLGQPLAEGLALLGESTATVTAWAGSRAQGSKPPLLARLLASQLEGPAPATELRAPALAVGLLDGDEAAVTARLGRLAQALAGEPGFWTAPQIDGAVPDSGPWSRRQGPDRPARSAWDRLIARAVDLLRLAEPDGATWLSTGALSPAPGEGLAWTEMARGLLIHWVRLDASGQTVTACRVLAPTEWNFHPRGLLAQAMSGLSDRPAGERPLAAQRLTVAFDPCVAFSIQDGPTEGSPHA